MDAWGVSLTELSPIRARSWLTTGTLCHTALDSFIDKARLVSLDQQATLFV
uniref:Uncharacterized protein n=1 Tax=Solanum tuberosum TaxID=4113 RepID=M1DI94_SOLTU